VKAKTTGYQEDRLDGMLRYVQMSVERSTGKVQLTLVWNAEDYRAATPHLQLLVKEIKARAPDLFHSIWANFNTGAGNAILSRNPHSWHRCNGPEYLKEVVGPAQPLQQEQAQHEQQQQQQSQSRRSDAASTAGDTSSSSNNGLAFSFSPQLFRQANLDQFSAIVAAVADWTPAGATVCELYAGVGVLGLNVLHKAEWVRCSDVNSANPRAFERAKERIQPQRLASQVSYQVCIVQHRTLIIFADSMLPSSSSLCAFSNVS
jgi:23S rRNA (uracil1939-C5)-methyltransferase